MIVTPGDILARCRALEARVQVATQAINAATLSDVTYTATATAYSLGQQLITIAWNILFAIVLVALVFGWSGGKLLVTTSYSDAKVKAVEMKESRRSKDDHPEGEGAEAEA